MDHHPVAWLHETSFPTLHRRASRARELVGHPLRAEGSPAAPWGGRAVVLHAVVAISRLGGHLPSRPVSVHTEAEDIDDRPRRVGTDQPVHNHEDLWKHAPHCSHAAQRQLHNLARHGWPWTAAVPGRTGRSHVWSGGTRGR